MRLRALCSRNASLVGVGACKIVRGESMSAPQGTLLLRPQRSLFEDAAAPVGMSVKAVRGIVK